MLLSNAFVLPPLGMASGFFVHAHNELQERNLFSQLQTRRNRIPGGEIRGLRAEGKQFRLDEGENLFPLEMR